MRTNNVTHLPPAWATAKDRTHPAWQPFLSYLKEDGEEATPKLWTMWYAAFLRGETIEWEKQFRKAAEQLDRPVSEQDATAFIERTGTDAKAWADEVRAKAEAAKEGERG